MSTQARTRCARKPAPAPISPAIGPRVLQRKCACGGTPGLDGECAQCRAKRLRRESARHTEVPASVHATLRSPGQPLEPSLAGEMGERLGHDFGAVRVHTDTRAAESARAVGALAYTVGREVVFGAGAFAPATREGRRILAHELVHVAQNAGRTGGSGDLVVGDPESVQEKEANALASRVLGASDNAPAAPLRPTPSAGSSPVLQRQLPYSVAAGATAAGAGASSVSSEGGGGAGPAPAAGGGSCRIDVAATHIGGFLSGMPVWHLLVVYADSSGTEYFYRGGPGGSCSGVPAGGYGTIQSTRGPYVPGTIDYPPIHRVTVLSGPTACGKDSCFVSELSRIDSLCTPYAATGPNSNTVARTLLANCGVPQSKPVWVAPGWGDPVL